jgi:putative oxygen-independent coproporphyrinogen III oxidase
MRTDGASPDDPALADVAASWVGAYLHVPFCRRVCPYCDFAVVDGREDLRVPYLAALRVEIEAAEPFSRPLDAVFVGGGTPTSIAPEALGAVLETLRHRFGLAPDAEVSIEANPEDVDAATAGGLVAAGFNRVSLGVQSFDPDVLSALGRRHTAEQADRAIATARAHFGSVNVDLIFGTPGESPSSWMASVRRALDGGIDHLSTYALTVERGTPLGRAVAAGAPAPDPDDQADKYLAAADAARLAGLVRYETSNFARPGHACRYNLLTWAGGDYAAFGNGAHRHRGGVRSWNVRRIDRYVERSPEATSGEERLDAWAARRELAMIGLRRAAGIAPGPIGDALAASAEAAPLVAGGVLEVGGGRIRVLRPLLGDEVSRVVLGLEPPADRGGATG